MIDSLIQTISNPESTTKTDYIDFRSPDVQHKKTGKFNELIIYTDGASRGNPGKAGIGVAILDKDNHVVEELCRFIGRTTNNVAEYRAMILAAQKAIEYHAKKVIFKTDSELLVRQLNGIYQVKSPNILPLYHELMALLRKIPDWEARHVFREKNARADALANRGIDSSGPN
ncbi:MAG: ribonuclease HI family protein [wastewater metagenome]|nr:ribonuclease HI family protein [Candidatus Loosdrechtia aerotolerans]